MAEICCEVSITEGENNPVLSTVCESTSSRAARRRRMEIRRFKFVAGVPSTNNNININTSCNNSNTTDDDDDHSGIIDATKRPRIEFAGAPSSSSPKECIVSNAVESSVVSVDRVREMITSSDNNKKSSSEEESASTTSLYQNSVFNIDYNFVPKFGVASVCGRRRDMEDAIAVHPSFLQSENNSSDSTCSELHYFGVYDGHGCSHVHFSLI